jgi:histidine triad (HIT) family protein
MQKLTPEQQKKQELYRDARATDKYDEIWQSVNKCVFCDLKDKYIFFEENGVVMTISLYAYIDGHFMIVPRRHIRSAKELTQLEWETIRKFTYIAKKLIKDVHGIKGMQIIQKDGSVAQSTVEHIHFHCIPFDSADLSVWNYRKLKNTPLENVDLYKRAGKSIVKNGMKFERKYKNYSSLPIACDLIICNKKNQILFQVRSDEHKLLPDYLSIPGGKIDDLDSTLESELAREVLEEINYELDIKNISLVSSRIGDLKYEKYSRALAIKYPEDKKFLWNTYVLRDFDENTKLSPGDDCKELIWVDLVDVKNHTSISPGVKAVIDEAGL